MLNHEVRLTHTKMVDGFKSRAGGQFLFIHDWKLRRIHAE